MTDGSSARPTVDGSVPTFRFKVRWGDKALLFEDVVGLDGPSTKRGDVTMKNGLYRYGGDFWKWFEEIRMNAGGRRTVVISRLDDNGVPTTTWTLNNVWPTRISSNPSEPGDKQVTLGRLDLFHEGIEVTSG